MLLKLGTFSDDTSFTAKAEEWVDKLKPIALEMMKNGIGEDKF
jgi:hypothetical protein